MEKLPPTSYVRMVDVWLIFGQLIPFIEVSLLTIMELYNVETDKVNHHGTAINIKNPVSIQLMLCYSFSGYFIRTSTLLNKPLLELNWLEMGEIKGTRSIAIKSILILGQLLIPTRMCWCSSKTYFEIQTYQNGPKLQVFEKYCCKM